MLKLIVKLLFCLVVAESFFSPALVNAQEKNATASPNGLAPIFDIGS